MQRNKKWPNCKPGKPGNGYSNLHKKNFNLLMNESYFNTKEEYVSIKIPCPFEKFEIKKVYEIPNSVFLYIGLKINLKILLIHIKEPTGASSQGQSINYFLDGEILFNEIYDIETCERIRFEIEDHQSLLVLTLNDDITICPYKRLDKVINNLTESIKIKPEEAGGGVIVTGP